MRHFYAGKRVCITGGAGFIGSHLLDRLIGLSATVTVADNLSSGHISNVFDVWNAHGLHFAKRAHAEVLKTKEGHTFHRVDLKDPKAAERVIAGHDIVFHLAAEFGGRGYIDTHPANCCENFTLNTNVIKAAWKAKVERIAYASTACVYPTDLQKNYNSTYVLKEDDAFSHNWANSDREYGWAKLMGEMTLRAYLAQFGLKSSITRYVTAYGPREDDTHAIIALIRRAILHKDPYVVWGSGQQDRDFTYVDDIVEGTLRACFRIDNATPVNLGTQKRYKMKDVARMICAQVGYSPDFVFDRTKPEGVKTRALSIRRAKKLLGWEPKVHLAEGIARTIAWYEKARPKSVETII
jgi:nucleoside-diphosphate-sugar epimerase